VDLEDLAPDPIAQFRAWLVEAEKACPQPHAMTLATADPSGRPSARMVLLRGHDERGFVFFTNKESRKGRELQANPRAAVVFHWWEVGRQVRIEGVVEAITTAESATYWRTRPRDSRIAAWASPQSSVVTDRAEVDRLFAEAAGEHRGEDVPLPPFWGGFRIVPRAIELWSHHDDRLHDRIRYTRAGGVWRRERLAP
jgi:pyridoxamine 5'-phosphate oxidase